MKFNATKTTQSRGVKTVISIQANDLSIFAISELRQELELNEFIEPLGPYLRVRRFLRGVFNPRPDFSLHLQPQPQPAPEPAPVKDQVFPPSWSE